MLYSYYPNGALRTRQATDTGGVDEFRYSPLGQISSVFLASGKAVSYEYDGLGRRIDRTGSAASTHYVYRDGLNLAAVLDGTGALLARFVYASRPNVPDFMVVASGTVFRIISDQLGSPRVIVNSATGEIVQSFDYDELGNRTTLINTKAFPDAAQPFGFGGGLFDDETKLVHFGARDYDPSVGRWISKDPILFRGRQTNLYVYVNNDPVNHRDPRGLTVYARQEKDWSKYWTAYYGFSHAYIRTDSNAFGLYPSGPPYFDPAQIADDSSSEGECVPIPDVDEPCVDGFARSGANWGPYGLSNNCGTFVADVLNVCRSSSPSMPFDGGEGGPGNVPDSPYPPGGY